MRVDKTGWILALLLTACQPSMPATIKPQPPLVDCILPMDANLDDIPPAGSGLTEWKVYAVKVLGVVTDDRTTHGLEVSCLDKLRAAGLIR